MDLELLKTMRVAGIELVACVESPAGGETVTLEPEDVEPFMADPAEWFARKSGAFKSQYSDWLATNGTPRCGATTASGKRCGNHVSGGVQRSFETWLQEDGGFCVVHGGEPGRRR